MFKKSDPVLKISRWNSTGAFFITPATVRSCGKKQMVLFRRGDENDCLGRNFRPQVKQYDLEEIRPDMPRAEAEARALELSAMWIAREIERNENCIERAGPTGGDGYVRALRRNIEELRAATPAVLWK